MPFALSLDAPAMPDSRIDSPIPVQPCDDLPVHALVALILDPHKPEFALVDVREKRAQAEADHLLHSVPLPLSQLEHDAPRLLPSHQVRVVVVDEQGGDIAQRAARRLGELGYVNVQVLQGGVSAWRQAGYEVYTGVCAYSKAFGEFVEHQDHTPSISAQDLKARLDAHDNVLVVDGRSTAEFLNFSIPGAYSVPNAELPLRVPGLVQDDATLVVVNCAGRTRSIIGAQCLINAGLANPVVALRNGTMDWLKEGFTLHTDELREGPLPDGQALASARSSVTTLTERYAIDWLGQDQLEQLQAQAHALSLYLIDVRTREEYDAGHLPGARWVPGGELVQWLGRHVAVKNSRVVLVDDEEGARAAITASWLLQLNLGQVHGLRTHAAQRTERFEPPAPAMRRPQLDQWNVAKVRAALERDEVLLVDFSSSPEFVRGHIPGARYGRRHTLDLDALRAELGARTLVLTSTDGTVAAWAAHDLREALPHVQALNGGNAAWRDAGLALQPGEPAQHYRAADTEPFPYEAQDRQAAFDAYLAWEIELLQKVARDTTVRFRSYPPAPPTAKAALPDTQDRWSEPFARIAAAAPVHESAGTLPHTEVQELLKLGFGALLLPQDIGGAGLNYRELFALIVRLAAADANVAHIFRNHYGFVNNLLVHPDRTTAEHWLRRVALGELFANGVTDVVRPVDPDGRVANLGRFATTLRREGQVQVLDGHKQYATGSLYAHWLAVQATREDGSETVTVVVKANAPGIQIIDDWTGFGQRFTGSGTVRLEQVQVENDVQVLSSLRSPGSSEYTSSLPQLFLTAVIAGIVTASFDDAQALIKQRKQHLYFAPASNRVDDPLLLHTLGQLSANAFAAQAIIAQAAQAFDDLAAQPQPQRAAASHAAALAAAQAKVSIDALGPVSATLLFDVAGASATHRANQLDRHWRNARTVATHNPSLYKALAIGAYHARGEALPKQGFF